MSGIHATQVVDTRINKHLDCIAQQGDRVVRRELRNLAQGKWPEAHLFRIFPIHRYRLQKQVEPGTTIWWIEQDISSYDLYLCSAYRVDISLSESENPELIVRRGVAAHLVESTNIKSLRLTLKLAGSEEPLIVHRQFGAALDP